MKIRNIAFHRIKAALALGAGIALLAPAASPYSLKAEAAVQQPEDMDDETWGR